MNNIKAMLQKVVGIYNDTKEWKSGARNSKADQEIIQEMHDLAGELGAKHGDGSMKTVEHPAAQRILIQTMHDHSASLGADCGGTKSANLEEYVNNVRAEFQETFSTDTYSPKNPYCVDVLDDCVVARFGELYYKVPYTETDGDIEFEEDVTKWTTVEKEWTDVAAKTALAVKIAARKDVNPKAGLSKYGDVSFADAKNHKYPIDNEEHIRAAFNYINKPKNAAKYSTKDLKKIKDKIIAAWKDKIDKDGPPSAVKSTSIQDLVNDLREAWYAWWQEDDDSSLSEAETTYPDDTDETEWYCPFVVDVLDDSIVVKIKGKEYKVPYTINGVDDYSFSQPDKWVQVEESWEEVKSAGLQPLLDDEVIIYTGGAVKSDENGMLGGYLVPFTDAQHTDSTPTKDFFDKKTDYRPYAKGMRIPIWFNHTLAMKSATDKIYQVKEQIGEGELDDDEQGIFFKDVILFNNFRYRKALEMAIKSSSPDKPLVGWSSGTAPHLMQRTKVGAANHIDRWPLGLDASITPTPAGFKLGVGVTSVKTGYQFQTDLDLEEAEDPAQVATTKNEPPTDQHAKSSQGNFTMTKEEQQALAAETAKLVLQAQKDEAAAIKAAQDKEAEEQAAFDTKVAEAIKKYTQPINRAMPAVKAVDTKSPAINKLPLGEDGDGTMAFNHWLKTGDNGGLRADSAQYSAFPDLVDPDAVKSAFERMEARGIKTDYNFFGDTTYQGAELVPTLVYSKVIELRDKKSIARLAGAQVLPVGSKVMNVPIEKDRSGRFVIQASGTPTEGGTMDPNAVQILDKKVLTMYDFTRTVEMSNQVLADSVTNLESWWNRHLARMEGVTENYFFVVGTGTLMPLGALYGGANGKTLASAATVTAAELQQLYHSMKQQYRSNSTFLATSTSMGIIRSLAGSYAFSFVSTPSGSNNNLGNAGEDWIFSPTCKVYESDDLPEFGNGTKPFMLAQFEEYLIGERQALSVFRDPYSRAKYNDTCFHCLFRRGGSTVTNEAFKYATCVST